MHWRTVSRLLFGLAAVLAASVLTISLSADAPGGEKLSDLLDRFRGERPGVAAIVLEDGEIVFAEAAGLADLGTGAPFTLDTPVQTGSLAKPFTAYAIALLERDGRLSFDDPVSKHIGELPDYGHPLTIRHLLNHQSGLRDQWGAFWMAGYEPSDLAGQDAMLRFITRQAKLDFVPGTEYNYANSNYTLLAEIIARVSGQGYPEFMADRVFGPLGMTSTRAVAKAFSEDEGEAVSYAPDGEGGFVRVPFAAETFGPHNIVSSARDLGRWIGLFSEPESEAGSLLASMSRPAKLASGQDTVYGMGLIDIQWLGAQHIHHFGVDAGYRAYSGFYPEAGAGLVLLANSADADLPDLAQAMAEAAFPERLAIPGPRNRVAAPLPASLIDRIAGSYRVVSGPALRANNHPYEGPFAVKGGPLVTITRHGAGIAIGSAWSAPLPFEDTGTEDVAVRTRMGDIVLRTDILADGPIDELVLDQYGETRLVRVEENGGSDLSALEGRYVSDELETFYDVSADEGRLRLSHIRTGTVTLQPEAGEGRFTGPWIFGAVQFEKRDGEDMMLVSYGRARQIPFRKVAPASP
jgi:CubicO group peptidase (beta-lactamase class C family)